MIAFRGLLQGAGLVVYVLIGCHLSQNLFHHALELEHPFSIIDTIEIRHFRARTQVLAYPIQLLFSTTTVTVLTVVDHPTNLIESAST